MINLPLCIIKREVTHKKQRMTRIISRINRNRLLAVSIGIIYLWFGVLKFFPGVSPADSLAKETITFITFGFIPEKLSILILALLEVSIGFLLILNYRLKKVVVVALVHLIMTFAPMLFFPETSFSDTPFALTLLGQYIMKNIVIICALLYIYPLDNEIKNQQNREKVITQ